MELNIKEVTKSYKDKNALENVSIKITDGIWGLLGENGAGKTTLMQIIAGLIKPTFGSIELDNTNINTLKESYYSIFGYLPQYFGFYPEFTVNDYLEYVAILKGLSMKSAKTKIDELLEKLSLKDVKFKKIIKLSGGMKRRVGIAQSLINDPKILILDEPTTGLDPGERIRFRNFLSEYGKDKIILISTHIVSDIEYISTQNAIIKQGKIIVTGTTEELLKNIKNKVWNTHINYSEVNEDMRKILILNMHNEEDNKVSIRYFSDNPINDDSIQATPRLEDLYMSIFPKEVGGIK